MGKWHLGANDRPRPGFVRWLAHGGGGGPYYGAPLYDENGPVEAPGYVTDLFSAFYPMSAASPVLASLHLEDHGLRWTHAPKVLAHPRPDAGTRGGQRQPRHRPPP